MSFMPVIEQNEERKTDQGSMENLCPGKASDEQDRALQTSPQPPEGPGLPRRSPLIRNRKAGSMEVMGGAGEEEEGVETQYLCILWSSLGRLLDLKQCPLALTAVLDSICLSQLVPGRTSLSWLLLPV